MKNKLTDELLLVKNVVKKYYDDYYEFLNNELKNSKVFNVVGLSGRIYYDDKFTKYVNKDYVEFSEYLYDDVEKVQLLKKIKEIINEPITGYVSNNDQYYYSISINSSIIVYLSGLLKYYVIDNRYCDDKEMIKLFEQFFINRGYTKLTKELGETELDIEGEDYHSRERHVEVFTRYYNDFCPPEILCNDGKDGRQLAKNKQEDLEIYLKSEYLGKYKVKHLLFGENFDFPE